MKNLGYFGKLLRSLGWSLPQPGHRATLGVLVIAVLAGTAAVSGSAPGVQQKSDVVVSLEERARSVSTLLSGVETAYVEHVAPIEQALLAYRSDDPQLVRRVAVSLVREARRADLDPRLLLAVLLVENPWIDPSARSFVGAQGLMQVMPLHLGNWKKCKPDLESVESNICHGAQIFASYFRATGGDIDRALLRYNGCVNGTNTPNCKQYPNHVYARAGRASMLAWRTSALAASR